MAGPLALVGGDELNPGNEPQDRLLVEAARRGPAYVLATAAARQRPELAVGHARAWFSALGLDVEELPVRTRTQARSPEVAQRAAAGGFFYLVVIVGTFVTWSAGRFQTVAFPSAPWMIS